MKPSYYEPLTLDELEDNQTIEDQIWMQEQDVKAGYVQPRELADTENPDSQFYGEAKARVFLSIWMDDNRFWIPMQSDLKANWADRITGTELDFDILMPDDSIVRVIGSKQRMEAIGKAGNLISAIE